MNNSRCPSPMIGVTGCTRGRPSARTVAKNAGPAFRRCSPYAASSGSALAKSSHECCMLSPLVIEHSDFSLANLLWISHAADFHDLTIHDSEVEQHLFF